MEYGILAGLIFCAAVFLLQRHHPRVKLLAWFLTLIATAFWVWRTEALVSPEYPVSAMIGCVMMWAAVVCVVFIVAALLDFCCRSIRYLVILCHGRHLFHE